VGNNGTKSHAKRPRGLVAATADFRIFVGRSGRTPSGKMAPDSASSSDDDYWFQLGSPPPLTSVVGQPPANGIVAIVVWLEGSLSPP